MLFQEFKKSQAEQEQQQQFSNFMDRDFTLAVKNDTKMYNLN